MGIATNIAESPGGEKPLGETAAKNSPPGTEWKLISNGLAGNINSGFFPGHVFCEQGCGHGHK